MPLALPEKSEVRMCPECRSDSTVEPFDYGVCRETGYHDAPERYTCRDCGGGDADEL